MDIFYHHFETLESTNRYAKERLLSFERKALTVISSDEQTRGSGRGKHSWHSPRSGNLYASLCAFAGSRTEELHSASLLLALSAAWALEEEGYSLRLKWPNDLLLSGKKAAGILCELHRMEGGYLLVNGIGVNVNAADEELGRLGATSLFLERGFRQDPRSLLHKIAKNYRTLFCRFLKEGFSPFSGELKRLMPYRKGDPLRFSFNGEVILGRFERLESHGALCLAVGQELKSFTSGELLA